MILIKVAGKLGPPPIIPSGFGAGNDSDRKLEAYK